MWRRCAEPRWAVLTVLVCLGSGCGDRSLALRLTVADSCASAVPAGGSLLYEVLAEDPAGADGSPSSFCGGCLPVTAPLSGASALIDHLRTQAPACAGVRPATSLLVRLTAWSVAGCPTQLPTALLFCAAAPSVRVPDGRSDGEVAIPLSCGSACAACIPTSCAREGKDCDPISNGCGAVLECGTCKPPLKCGGAGVANVCGK